MKIEIHKCAFAGACLTVLLSTGVACADQSTDLTESTAPSFRLGGIKAYPGLSVVEKSDSNIHLSDANKTSSLITVLSPSVVLQAKQSANIYALTYSADIGRYAQSSTDDFNDQNVLGGLDFSLSSRASLRFTPEYKLGHDQVGSTYGGNSTPNIWQNAGVTGAFKLGSDEAPASFEFRAAYQDREYQNNQTVTFAYNKLINELGGTFNYRLSPKVTSFFQVNDTSFAYKDGTIASNLDSSEQRYMLGATWEKTVQTSGSFKIGDLQKAFNSSAQATYNITSWEGAVRWSPLEYVRVDFDSSKRPLETTLLGSSFELITNNSLEVAYDLTALTSVHANAGNVTEDFIGLTTPRSDVSNLYGWKVDYKIQSWLVGGVEYSNIAKSSTDSNAPYHREIFLLSIRTQL